VSTNERLDERLRRIEQILASSPTGSRTAGAELDVADVMLAAVTTDRIRQTMAELDRGTMVDAVDAVTMRLLLADYGAAVAGLRGVARTTEQRLDDLADSLRGGSRVIDRAENRDRKAGARSPAAD
jgi:hypothetical protein